MKKKGKTVVWAVLIGGLLIFGGLAGCVTRDLPKWIANGLTRPYRKPLDIEKPPPAEAFVLQNDPVTLHGWRFPATTEKRATLIYLHGVADNRGAVVGVAERFCPRGFEVIAYDSRAHGESTGEFCTYGFYEKEDLKVLLDTLDDRPVVVVGNSMGAAVALLTAAEDPRIDAIVSMETFGDLRSVSRDRAPWFISDAVLRDALSRADALASFQVDAVSPATAAEALTIPVLVIHGADDRLTPPRHSERVYAALRGPKDWYLVKGADHNESGSTPGTWTKIQEWIESDGVLPEAEG